MSHLPVAAEERLHRPRADGTPHLLLRVRQEVEEEEQAVSRVPDAHPVGHPHLPKLRPRPQLTHLPSTNLRISSESVAPRLPDGTHLHFLTPGSSGMFFF